MNIQLESLQREGCKMDEALHRVLDDEELLLELLQQAFAYEAVVPLGEHLGSGEFAQAFEEAHALKGVFANLGLTPLYDIMVRIVEPLRTGKAEDLLSVYEELLERRELLERAFVAGV